MDKSKIKKQIDIAKRAYSYIQKNNDVIKRSHGAYDDTPDEIGTRPLENPFVWYDSHLCR